MVPKPIIILSTRKAEDDIVKAPESGANYYLTKPFRIGELLAHIRVAILLSQGLSDNPVLTIGNLKIDIANHVVRKNEEIVKLTSIEYSLLTLLAKNEGRVLTHQFIEVYFRESSITIVSRKRNNQRQYYFVVQ